MQDQLRQQLIRDLWRIMLTAVAAVALLVLAPEAGAEEPGFSGLDAAIEVAQTELEASVLDAREESAEERNPHFAALVEGTSIRRVTLKCVVPHANGMMLGDCSNH